MDPLNKQERKEATLKMLAFFLLAVVVVAVPMYFAFKMPEKEAGWNEKEYKDLFDRMEQNDQFEAFFKVKTDSALSLYSAYQGETDEVARDKIRIRYSKVITEMEDSMSKIEGDSVKVSLYDNVIFTYDDLFSAWSEKNVVQKQLDECQEKSQSQSQALSEKEEIISVHTEKAEEEESKSLQEKEIELIKKALEKHNGSKSRAAKELGTTERKLRKRMKELGI